MPADEPSDAHGSLDSNAAADVGTTIRTEGRATRGNDGQQVGGRATESDLPQHGSALMVTHAANHKGPRQLCSYTESDLQAILSMPHSCGFKEKRYFHDGSWMTWRMLRQYFNNSQPTGVGEGTGLGEQREEAGRRDVRTMECVLACKYHKDLRCSPSQPCVHAFHLRPNSTGSARLRTVQLHR